MEIEAKEIQKYSSKSIPQLLEILKRHIHLFIRTRDRLNGCISCKNGAVEDAGHFWETKYSFLRFHEWNINGQCSYYCNKMKSGNLLEYRLALEKKIGKENVQWLDDNRNNPVKWDRFSLIEKILRYKELNKINSVESK